MTHRPRWGKHPFLVVFGVVCVGWVNESYAQDLILDGDSIQLGGIHTYDTVSLINNSRIVVPNYNNADMENTGNLQIVARSITIDATSSIVADGAGYTGQLCDHGGGGTATGGGRGGCAVRDSGGGGAHYGQGGRGTKDCFLVAPADSCQFPAEFEESCGTRNGTSCSSISNCYNYDALPSVSGVPFTHSIYEVEFGAAGGDKGCRDGDGWSCRVAGDGGGRIVLAAVDHLNLTGSLVIHGQISTNGERGCGDGNDSGGGGAGGSILLVGDDVTVSSSAVVSAAGGLGGDTNAKQPGSTCPSCAQNPGGTCDDCGGGGGGGIIAVLSRRAASLADLSVFDVSGADGGTCQICKGEAGGGAGELQLSGVYTGEFCDGYDNDFDGLVDEDLGQVSCGTGACQVTVDRCNISNLNDVFPNDCIPQPDSSCLEPLENARSRFMVIVDTSGSMLTDLNGNYTFGDGSVGHLGLDTNGDGIIGNDSRLFKAKRSLTQVISAYPEIDFGLSRFTQGVGEQVNCQLAHWFECAGLCCTYDDPTNNSGVNPEGPCTVSAGSAGNLEILPESAGEECINYAGTCGAVRRGADILVGFSRPLGQSLMWLDHQETQFLSETTEGDHCNFAGGGDCELRGTGPTPIAGALQSVKAYAASVKALDPVAYCRNYAVILLTDGAETCRGNPVTAAGELLSALGIETYVIGFSVLSSEESALNAIANAGSISGSRPAIFVGDEEQLTATLATIVAGSVRFEQCNDLDDDCDTLIDEDFPLKGQPCNNGRMGVCYRTGVYVCSADGKGVECNAPDGGDGIEEICNGLDDDCDGAIDEDIPGGCIPPICGPEICNNLDDDCDGVVDNNITSVPCGKEVGECKPGWTKCEDGMLTCDGSTDPLPEECNGLDDDCDGVVDGMSRPCYPFDSGCDVSSGICQGICRLGMEICTMGVWDNCSGAVGPAVEVCDGLDNNCDGNTDETAVCPGESQCINGQCTQPCSSVEFGCPFGQLCKNGWCVADPCDPTECAAQGEGWVCRSGECIDPCATAICRDFERCIQGTCVDTSCYTSGCGPGQNCVQGQCQIDPCASLACDPTTEFCSEGRCIKLCAYVFCSPGERCVIIEGAAGKETLCLKDSCLEVHCAPGQVCNSGRCVEDPCTRVFCKAHEVCLEGMCRPDPCEKTICPAGYSCNLGVCQPQNISGTTELLASGGGGFSCQLPIDTDAEGHTGLIMLFIGGILFLGRRRGQRRRQ